MFLQEFRGTRAALRANATSAYVSPYPPQDLALYYDANFGVSGVALDSDGNVTGWRSQVSGQPDALNTAQANTASFPTVDGYPCLDLKNSVFQATCAAPIPGPLTVFTLLKVRSTGVQYQVVYSYSDAANNLNTAAYIKENTKLLLFAGNYSDRPSTFPLDKWIVVGASFSFAEKFFYLDGQSEGGPGDGTNVQSLSFSGDLQIRLHMTYARGFSRPEFMNQVALIKQAYNL